MRSPSSEIILHALRSITSLPLLNTSTQSSSGLILPSEQYASISVTSMVVAPLYGDVCGFSSPGVVQGACDQSPFQNQFDSPSVLEL